jgi:hypothetical protein
MAYSDLDVDIVYVGDNSTTIFPINFARTDESFVQAELYDVSDPANPVQLTFANPTDWQIVGDDVVASVAPTTDQKLMIYRSSTPIHGTNYSEYQFPYETMNVDLDKVYQLAQENRRTLDRAALTPYFNYVSGDGDQLDVPALLALEPRVTQNEADIATLQADVTALQATIAGLTFPTIVSITSAATHNAANAEVVIIDTADTVSVALPTPTSGHFIRVKLGSNTDNKTVTHAAGIDGFGTTYTLSSSYESISLVADGSKWYIV